MIRYLLLGCALVIGSNCFTKKLNPPHPVVIWHGMGDSKEGMDRFKKMITDILPNVYVKCLRIGRNRKEDIFNTYFMNANDQVKNVCDQLAGDERLAEGYNAMGFSQGGQFMRAVVQRCPYPRALNLITFGAQHQGVFGIPHCRRGQHFYCEIIRRIMDIGAYRSFVQNHLVQAQYWHDPYDERSYIRKSVFLADINNERVKNETYKKNMLALNNFVMVKFTEDFTVIPRESEWFGFYKTGQDTVIQPLNDTLLYKQDRLGLREMNRKRKLHFLEVKGHHLELNDEWFHKKIVPFLL